MKLSIITVNLNNRDGLQRTIDSVVNQTFTDYEWIVIDGGSTDGSKELIEQYAMHFAYWCSEPDKGVYSAMNKGIAHAKGEWLQFLNSGDWLYEPQTLEYVFSNIHNAKIIYGKMLRKDGTLNNQDMMKETLHWSDFIYGGLPHQSTFIKRELFDKIGLYDEKLKAVSDWKFFVTAIVYNKIPYIYIPKIISIYEGDGISDIIGQEERAKEKINLFPAMILDDLYKIQTYDYLYSENFSKKITDVLLKLIHWKKKRKK